MAGSLTSSRRDYGSLVPALSKALERVGEGSVSLSVCLTDSQEVIALREEVEALKASLEAERALRIRAENLFADESYLNNELIDLCREHNVPVPRYYFTRKKKT